MLRLISALFFAGLFAQDARPPAVRVLGGGILQASWIARLSFSPDSKYLAGASGHEVVIWDLATLKEVRRIPANEYVIDLRYLTNGNLLFLTSGVENPTGETTLWDPRKNEKIRSFETPNDKAHFTLTPDEKTILLPEYLGPELHAWDLATGRPIEGLPDAGRSGVPKVKYMIYHAAFSADGARLAVIDEAHFVQDGAPHDERARVSIWDWKTRTMTREWFIDEDLLGWSGDLRWLPDGKRLLLPSWKAGYVVNATDGKASFTFPGRPVSDPAVERLYALSGKECVTRDAKTGAKLAHFAVPRSFEKAFVPRLSADGKWLAAADGGSVVLIDLNEKLVVAPLVDSFQSTPSLTYTPDGRLLAFDGAVTRVYDDASGHLLARFAAGGNAYGCAPCFTSDGRRYFVADEKGRLELWDPVRAQLLASVPFKKEDWNNGMWMTPDGRFAATVGHSSGTLQFRDMTTGAPMGRIVGPPSPITEFPRRISVGQCLWNAAGDLAFISSSDLDYTGVWNPKTGKIVRNFKDVPRSHALALNEKADLVYIGWQDFNGLWKASDGTWVRNVESPGRDARFSLDGKSIIGFDAVVDVETGKDLLRFEGKGQRAVSPSGRLIAVFDDAIRILDTKTGKEVARPEIPAAGKIVRLAWHPAERQIAVTVDQQAQAFQVDLPCGDEGQAKNVDALRKANDHGEPIKVTWK